MMTYATMTSHQPVRKPVRPSSATEVARMMMVSAAKPYFTSLPLKPHCLNFKAKKRHLANQQIAGDENQSQNDEYRP